MAVYEVYVNYFSYGAQYVTTETKMYEIPSSADNVNKLVDPKVKTEMGKTGSFEFSMYYGHPYYACWYQMKTMLRVTYYGETIFYGRVLTIDVDHITTKKTIHCEGYLAFLMDTQQEGVADGDRTAIWGSTYVSQLLTNHNTQVANVEAQMTTTGPNKRFQLGMMPGNYSGADANQQIKMEAETYKYGSSSWEDTASAFSGLIKIYGGYLRTRYVDANTVYLDWLESYFRSTISDRVIEIGTNVISMSSSSEVENIFTVLIPVGKNLTNSANSDAVMLTPKELYVKDIGSVYTDEDLNVGYHSKSDYTNSLNQYGMIVKSQSFQNADTVAKLREYAWDYIKNNYHGGLTSFTVSAIDMKVLGGSDIILAGDQVRVRYVISDNNGSPVWESKVLTVLSAEYDLLHPEKNSYDIGIPDNALNKTYGTSAEKSSNSSASGKGGGGISQKKDDEDQNAKNRKADHIFYAHVLDASNDNPEYAAYKAKYGDKAASSILQSTVLTLDQAVDEEGTPTTVKNAKQRLKTLLLDGHNGTLSGFVPQDESSSIFAGKSNEWMSDYYATQASLTLDSFRNGITFQEQIETIGEWAREDFQDPTKRNKIILQMKIDKKTDATTGTSTQYGSVAMQRASRGTADVVTEETKTMMMGGYNGKYVGGKAQFVSSFSGDSVESLINDATDNLLGSINLNGSLAELSLTNLPQSVQDIVKTVKAQGNGTGGEGTLFAGWDGNKFLTQMNKEVSYTDSQGRSVSGTGFLSSSDIEFTDYMPSLRTTLLSVDVLLADYAEIGSLSALKASIESLDADWVQARLSEMGTVVVGNIQANTSAALNGVSIDGKTAAWTNSFTVVTDVSYTAPSLGTSTTRKFTYQTTSGTSSEEGKLVTSWSQGSCSVSTKSLYFIGTAV